MPASEFRFREGYLVSGDGLSLRWRVAEVEAPIADVLLTHGLGEYCGRYEHVAAAFASKKVRLWTYDLRGHGLSGGRRGDAGNYRLLLDDLAQMTERAKAESDSLFLMGHSMGGQITLSYLLRSGGAGLSGTVIMSPWLRLAFAPPRWRVLLAKAAMFVVPGLCQQTPGDATQLSRDQAHLAMMPSPELCHNVISGRLFFAVEKAGAHVLDHASELRLPILLLHGAEDSVTCRKATAQFHEQAGSYDKSLIIYPDARHETHNDLGRDRVISDVSDWITSRTPSAAAIRRG